MQGNDISSLEYQPKRPSAQIFLVISPQHKPSAYTLVNSLQQPVTSLYASKHEQTPSVFGIFQRPHKAPHLAKEYHDSPSATVIRLPHGTRRQLQHRQLRWQISSLPLPFPANLLFPDFILLFWQRYHLHWPRKHRPPLPRPIPRPRHRRNTKTGPHQQNQLLVPPHPIMHLNWSAHSPNHH